MLQNYLKIAWRQLTRNKLHSLINLGGLIIGFTIGIAILLGVYQQFSYDKFQAHRTRLYEAYQVFNHPDGRVFENSFPFAQGPGYKAGAPGIERATRIADGSNHIQYKGRDLSIPVNLVDADFFPMFSFPIVKGEQGNPLSDLKNVVLREDAAKEIFGNEDPIGKTLKVSTGNELRDLTVSAIIKDGMPSSINFRVLARIENKDDYATATTSWNGRSLSLYVELKPGVTQRQAEQQLIPIDQQHVHDTLLSTHLLPLTDAHFDTDVNGHHAAGIGQIIALLTVGLLIILIASFNFVNITLAAAFTRSREMGIRKCLGAVKWKLFLQLWAESLLVCTIAFLISLLLVNVLLDSVESLEKMRIALSGYIFAPGFLLLTLALLLGVSLLAGGYPALVMTRFRIIETLKGRLSIKRRSPLRRTLIVFQFVIACTMISCTFIAWQQYQHLQNAGTGIDKDNIVSVPLHNTATGRETVEKLRLLLASDPHIVSVTGSNINLGRGSDHRTVKIGVDFTYNGRKLNTTVAGVEYDYLETLGIKPVAGRDFDKRYATDTALRVVISQSLADQLGEKNPIGKYIGGDSSWAGWQVIGVYPDFHLYSLAEAQEPLMLALDPHAIMTYCFIRTTGRDPIASMNAIKTAMAQLEPGQDFNGSFVNENVNNWYANEQALSLSFGIAAIVAILLSCTGLLAMVLLIIEQRKKEIGVRKVLGATIRDISILVSREFLFLVSLAVVIATPIAWIAMNQWLRAFAYRIDIHIGIFVLVAITAIGLAMLTIGFNTIRAARQNPVKALRTE